MEDDELRRQLRRTEDAREEAARGVTEVRAALELLLTVLEGRGALNGGHRKLIAKVMERAGNEAPRRVRLNVVRGKRTLPNSEVDCASRIHLCRARCCTFSVELSREDLDEGKLRWEIEQPYLLRHDSDGYCSHFSRESGGCTVYEDRPAACRQYDCRQDARVWQDFEKRIPAQS